MLRHGMGRGQNEPTGIQSISAIEVIPCKRQDKNRGNNQRKIQAFVLRISRLIKILL